MSDCPKPPASGPDSIVTIQMSLRDLFKASSAIEVFAQEFKVMSAMREEYMIIAREMERQAMESLLKIL